MNGPNDSYLLENRHREAGLRLEAISALFDSTTFGHIRRMNLQAGCRCWEVGAGSPSIPLQLSKMAGDTGSVLATDIDISWLGDMDAPNISILKHDIVTEEPPAEPFDLIHARLVLVHLPNRDAVLKKLVGALKKGGWLLIEDADPALQPLACLEEKAPEHVLANKIRRGFRQLMLNRGVDLSYGRTLPRVLREAGLEDVMAEAFFPLARPECSFLEIATIELLRRQLIESGLATSEEIEINLQNLKAGRLDIATAPLISAWGRRSRN